MSLRDILAKHAQEQAARQRAAQDFSPGKVVQFIGVDGRPVRGAIIDVDDDFVEWRESPKWIHMTPKKFLEVVS